MRHRTHTVFDDYATPTAVNTDSRFNSLLGEHDMLALHAVADNATVATLTVSVYVQHSSDGRNWLFRSSNGTSTPGTSSAEINLVFAATTDVPNKMWSDAALSTTMSGPLLSFVRLYIVTTSGAAHLKVHATQRGGSVG
jgi:hypothetical protein